MTKYAIISNEVEAKFFGKDGFKEGSKLTTIKGAKVFKTKAAADDFHKSMVAAGFTRFRVTPV